MIEIECPPDEIRILPEGLNAYITSGIVTNCVIMRCEYIINGTKFYAMGHFLRDTHESRKYKDLIMDFESKWGIPHGNYTYVGENRDFIDGKRHIKKIFKMDSNGDIETETKNDLNDLIEDFGEFKKFY